VKNLSSGFARVRQAAWAGCTALVLLGPAAQAQGLFDFFDPSPQRIESQLERAGYVLRAPLARRGDVYIGDVMAANGVHERLVIDARTTKIVARYPARGRAWRDAPPDVADSWFGSPRPPRGVGPGQTQEFDDFGPVRRSTEPDLFARADPFAPSGIFNDDAARPKPKPHVVKPRNYGAPAAKAAPTAPDASAAPGAAPPATAPAAPDASASPPAASAPAPADSGKAAPARVAAPAPAAEAVKPVADAKPVAEATVAPAAPQPRPSPKPKALNDLPVTPLD
jgi:hypothetical protein